MADANTAPRRISMAYILGFSNKPFKDGGPPAPAQPPPPRHPSNFKQMVSTPGGVIEWAASDGRRGRLTGPGKPRLTPHLTASNLAQIPEAKVEVVADKETGNDDGGMGMMALFDETAAAPASVKVDPPADSGWTKEQDEKLMELRADSGPWAATAEELGKKEHECKERFKQIKPADWRSKDKGKGGNQKNNKQKGGKNHNQNSQNNQNGAKDKGGDTKNANGASADNTWGWTNTGNNGDTKDNTNAWTGGDTNWGATGGEGDNKSNKGNNNAGGGFNTDENGWGSGGGDSGNNGSWQDTGGNDGGGVGWNTGGEDAGNNDAFGGGVAWDTNDANGNTEQEANNNTGGWSFNDNNNTGMDGNNDNKGFDSNTNAGFGTNNNDNNNNNSIWNTAPTAPTAPSNPQPQPQPQPPQQPPSNTTKPLSQASPTPHPAEYELTPDTTFSASDLRLIARILQQDCQLVWNRVSWRFKDKTGRTLHPDVFERKVTGVVAGKRG